MKDDNATIATVGCMFQLAVILIAIVIGYWTHWTVGVGLYALHLIQDAARTVAREAKKRRALIVEEDR